MEDDRQVAIFVGHGRSDLRAAEPFRFIKAVRFLVLERTSCSLYFPGEKRCDFFTVIRGVRSPVLSCWFPATLTPVTLCFFPL